MLSLLHGENLSESRAALVKLVQGFEGDVFFWDKISDPVEFLRLAPSSSLFASKILLVFESSKAKEFGNPKFLEELAGVDAADGAPTVVLWVGGKVPLSSRLVKQVRRQGGRIFGFTEKVPKSIFPFLDALGRKDEARAFLELDRLLQQGREPIYILTMIVYHLRNTARVLFDPQESKKVLHPFVYKKTVAQAKNFSTEKIVQLYDRAFRSDLALKTSTQDGRLVLSRLVAETVRP